VRTNFLIQSFLHLISLLRRQLPLEAKRTARRVLDGAMSPTSEAASAAWRPSRSDKPMCHCERSEAISLSHLLLEQTGTPEGCWMGRCPPHLRLLRRPGGLLAVTNQCVIASAAKQSRFYTFSWSKPERPHVFRFASRFSVGCAPPCAHQFFYPVRSKPERTLPVLPIAPFGCSAALQGEGPGLRSED